MAWDALLYLEVWARDLFPWSLGHLDGQGLWATWSISRPFLLICGVGWCPPVSLCPHRQPSPYHGLCGWIDHSMLPLRPLRPTVLRPLTQPTVSFPLAFLFCPSVPHKANGPGLEGVAQQNYLDGSEMAQSPSVTLGSMEVSGMGWGLSLDAHFKHYRGSLQGLCILESS